MLVFFLFSFCKCSHRRIIQTRKFVLSFAFLAVAGVGIVCSSIHVICGACCTCFPLSPPLSTSYMEKRGTPPQTTILVRVRVVRSNIVLYNYKFCCTVSAFFYLFIFIPTRYFVFSLQQQYDTVVQHRVLHTTTTVYTMPTWVTDYFCTTAELFNIHVNISERVTNNKLFAFFFFFVVVMRMDTINNRKTRQVSVKGKSSIILRVLLLYRY